MEIEDTGTVYLLFQNILEIPVIQWNHDRKELEKLSESIRFMPRMQRVFEVEALELFCESAKDYRIYEILDLLGLRLLIVRFLDQIYLIGPYVEKVWSDEEGERTLASLSLSVSELIPYKLYYCNYHVLETDHTIHIVKSILETIGGEKKSYSHEIVRGILPEKGNTVMRDYEEDIVPEFEEAAQRYKAENNLMERIQAGDREGALKALNRLNPMSSGLDYGFFRDPDALAMIGILRTIIRKAAEYAGLHPAIVDSISKNYSQKAYSARNSGTIGASITQMITEYCDAILEMREEHYSTAVRAAADYIKLHLSSQITLKEIGEAAGLTPELFVACV